MKIFREFNCQLFLWKFTLRSQFWVLLRLEHQKQKIRRVLRKKKSLFWYIFVSSLQFKFLLCSQLKLLWSDLLIWIWNTWVWNVKCVKYENVCLYIFIFLWFYYWYVESLLLISNIPMFYIFYIVIEGNLKFCFLTAFQRHWWKIYECFMQQNVLRRGG